jgi:putative solute:sodium symporter small subunit
VSEPQLSKTQAQPSAQNLGAYWQKNVSLIRTLLIIWAAVTFIPPLFAKQLSQMTMIGGWPMHYFLSAVFPLVVYLLLIFAYWKKMDALDQEYGVAEEEVE